METVNIPTKKANWKKRIIYIILIFIILIIGKNFFSTPSELKLKPTNFEFSTIQNQDIKTKVSATGAVNPVNVVSVGAQVSGRIDKIYVDYNDNVKQGQLLAEIDKSLLIEDINSTKAKMMQAKAKYDLAKLNKNRIEELFNSGYIAKVELDQAQTELTSSEADYISATSNYERSKRNMEYARITSPVSGVVISKDVEEGQTIASSFSAPTLFTIAEDLKKMQIEASISEADIGNIKKGQNVDFTVDAFPLETFRGVVDQVRLKPTTEQNVVIYNVIIKIDNKDNKLLPGMTAFVEINTQEKDNVKTLDNITLQYRPDDILMDKVIYPENKKLNVDEGFVYKYDDKTNTITAIKVKKGITNGSITEIISEELSNNDKVISDFNYEGKKQTKTNSNNQRRRGPGGPM